MITKDFGVAAEHLDFKNQALTVQTVNNFVSEATHKMIPSLLESDYYEPNTRAFLVNAVYFKGQWATPFSPDNTRKETFYGIKGERQVGTSAWYPMLIQPTFTSVYNFF
ncbi:hypothetical protein OESDEN_17191 [Oesophagostomum dentatum]|uniref:Serpin domain-containing protein n=1 Tax=Oesophagostomum dentatum TaxID=61180 RepID=A0A0B1SHZ1_OESDE|nr:hypothetical protein OESDEN_17191 [Oesophagostomum dentatum]